MSAGTGWLLSAGQKQCLPWLAFFKQGVVLLFYGTTLLPAALLVLQVKVPLEGWVMGEFWTLWGAFHVEQNVVDVPEQFVMEEILLGKANHSFLLQL